jgi:hypothetical protein
LFDQKPALASGLLSVMEQGEFYPADNPIDYAALTRFCDWVAQWQSVDWKLGKLRPLVEELTKRYGLPELWHRMLGPVGVQSEVIRARAGFGGQ